MEKKHNFWFGFAMLLLGSIIGFIAAPLKNGINWEISNSFNAQK